MQPILVLTMVLFSVAGHAQSIACDYEGFPGIAHGEVFLCAQGRLRSYRTSEILNLRKAATRLDPTLAPFLMELKIEDLEKKIQQGNDPSFVISPATVNIGGYGISTFGADLAQAAAEASRPGDVQFALNALMAYEQRSGQ